MLEIAGHFDHDRTGLAERRSDRGADLAAVMLYRNVRGQPGLRVRLQGRPANLFAVGASLRAVGLHGEGPGKEVQAGSGYWSQHSSVMVLNAQGGIQSVRVRWPGGEVTETAVAPGVEEVTLKQP
jgi:hypothetical protein